MIYIFVPKWGGGEITNAPWTAEKGGGRAGRVYIFRTDRWVEGGGGEARAPLARGGAVETAKLRPRSRQITAIAMTPQVRRWDSMARRLNSSPTPPRCPTSRLRRGPQRASGSVGSCFLLDPQSKVPPPLSPRRCVHVRGEPTRSHAERRRGEGPGRREPAAPVHGTEPNLSPGHTEHALSLGKFPLSVRAAGGVRGTTVSSLL